MSTDWARGFAWALDFCRAVRERPLWARVLFRVALGKYAYREFIGLQDTIAREGYGPYDEYSCQSVNYHADKVPFAWWKERDPQPLRKSLD